MIKPPRFSPVFTGAIGVVLVAASACSSARPASATPVDPDPVILVIPNPQGITTHRDPQGTRIVWIESPDYTIANPAPLGEGPHATVDTIRKSTSTSVTVETTTFTVAGAQVTIPLFAEFQVTPVQDREARSAQVEPALVTRLRPYAPGEPSSGSEVFHCQRPLSASSAIPAFAISVDGGPWPVTGSATAAAAPEGTRVRVAFFFSAEAGPDGQPLLSVTRGDATDQQRADALAGWARERSLAGMAEHSAKP